MDQFIQKFSWAGFVQASLVLSDVVIKKNKRVLYCEVYQQSNQHLFKISEGRQ